MPTYYLAPDGSVVERSDDQAFPQASAQHPDAKRINAPARAPERVADANHVRLAMTYSAQRFPKLYEHNAAAFQRVLTEFCKHNGERIEREFRQGDLLAFKEITEDVARHCQVHGPRVYGVTERPEVAYGPAAWRPLKEL